MQFRWRKKTALFLCTGLLSLGAQAQPSQPDPLEPYNRAMFEFNDSMDHLILKPVAQGYRKITPTAVQASIHRFYNNLNLLPTFGNDLLQGKGRAANHDFWRFCINTTVGLLGFFDVARHIGLQDHSEDAGLTFATWGWEKSTFVVLPFYGPSTVRDALGRPVDYYMSVYPYIHNIRLRNTLYFTGIVDTRSNLLALQDVIQQAALDPYVFQRNAYLQRRAYLIEQNDVDENEDADTTPQKTAVTTTTEKNITQTQTTPPTLIPPPKHTPTTDATHRAV